MISAINDSLYNMSDNDILNTKNSERNMNKIELSLIFLLAFSLDCISQEPANHELRNTAISGGIGLGSVLAVVVSWERNKSVLLT